ncbi:MAG: response regulator [Lachnospiraceae bacterium]|nr:response regulator [Lachnospiraceae bacterium]
MASWVVVVDDDISNLKIAGSILSKANMRVTALNSGQALLDYVKDNGAPDLILLDIRMPGLDGFETLKAYRLLEKDKGISEVPVVFLTADENIDSESRSFDLGVSDYIRKPFEPEILVRRVSNVLNTRGQILKYEEEATVDKMTGFLNKVTAEEQIAKLCAVKDGYLCIVDLDSFKLVNDIYGHDMGDKVLMAFADVLRNCVSRNGTFGRIGGDEFLVFWECEKIEGSLGILCENINDSFLEKARELMGKDMSIPLGASIGAAVVPEMGTDYDKLFRLADKALYTVKNNGKHGCLVYSEKEMVGEDEALKNIDLKTLSRILEERNIPQNAMWMGKEAFGNIYRYMIRYMDRYQGSAYKLLFTAKILSEDHSDAEREDMLMHVRELLQECLRNSDIMMQVGRNHFFLLLPEINEYNVNRVIDRINAAWTKDKYARDIKIEVEKDSITHEEHDPIRRSADAPNWVAVVDDDSANLTLVGSILSKNNMRVSALQSGQAFLDFMKDNTPDLILLDVKMPEMDGFETLTRLREQEGGAVKVPVIFLTADENEETETRGLALGAMDFIKKPLIPGSLVLRVKHTLELVHLQNHLTQEVERKTEENEGLSLHIVRALAEAIDAKDTYTNGHSDRVANYSREIARWYGYTDEKLNDIYMMGLLHDVGKIGIPDAVINKPAKLTEEEYDLIKQHPVMGARILKNITEMPQLANGARWHHERYDGKGYPDRLKGDDIPEEARIIAVADSYDAMTSRRSYRDPLPQNVVRGEIIKGSGTQFDPRFADIMLKMMDIDTDFEMREH